MTEKTSIENVIKSIERYRRLSLGLPIPVIRHDIPAGFKINPDNSSELVIDEKDFELLLQARKYLKDSPYSEVAIWLTKSGLTISHNGLHKLMRDRPPYTEDERRIYNTAS